jgi:carbonic anhydrase/acetyltransferase-like protein (isoleucine patch superfamily)
MGAIVLDDAVVGENCLVGAGSLLTMNKVFAPGTLIMGSPAKSVRDLTEKELKELRDSAAAYVKVSREYLHYFKGS